MLFFLPNVAVDEVELADAFDDIDVKGGRIVDEVTHCCLLPTFLAWRVASRRLGEESVKSSDSTSSGRCRSCGFVGTGAVSRRVTPRCLVGVTDARHASKVVCIDTDESLNAFVVVASFTVFVLAFFAGSREGEGCAGESIKSNVSIVFGSGGVEGRSKIVLVSAGSVFERWIGARLLLFVTLGGSSSRTGDGDFSRSGRGSGVAVRGLAGGEDKRSIVSCDASTGGDERPGTQSTLSCAFTSAREALSPGLVTFAKASMRT